MIRIVSGVITNCLVAIYQSLGFSLLTAVLVMFFYILITYGAEPCLGVRHAAKLWLKYFKEDRAFRRLFILVLFTVMILFRTLLNRNMWMNPLSDIMGGWSFYRYNVDTEEYVFTTECLENAILFLPFSFFLLQFISEKNSKKNHTLAEISLTSVKYVICASLTIEVLQLFLRVGTVQIADIIYNVLGGFLGGILYWITESFINSRKER